MAPKKKKGGQSKEELERLQREEEERQRLEMLLRLEKEAEELQRKENELRDAAELREKKRLKKEAQLKLMAEKDAQIVSLSNQLSALQTSFSAERAELEGELRRQRQLADSLDNALSVSKTEADEVQRTVLAERDSYATRIQLLEAELKEAKEKNTSMTADFESRDQDSAGSVAKLTGQVEKLSEQKAAQERELGHKIKSLERELEKVTSINSTLQDVIEAREADDRKNVTLMQLLNNQLDENKRRSQELLDEERLRVKGLQQQLATAEADQKQLQTEKGLTEQELALARDNHEREVSDFKAKIEQLKFDAKYLSAELQKYKKDLSQLQEEASNTKVEAQSETQDAKLAVETAQKKNAELESLLRRKDREHFDKVTFLNAQISNNRTIIGQLQQRLNKEREDHVAEVTSASSELDRKVQSVQSLHDDAEKRKVAAAEVEMKLNSDIAILKTTVFQLQSALVDRERELETISATKDEEVRQLRTKLDEHFIPHRAIEGGAASGDDVSAKLERTQRDLEVQSKSYLEAEARMKAQIANQNQIIDSLQTEMHKVKEDRDSDKAEATQEITRLRQTLDVHEIPYRK